ncbi:hypothetical protein CJ030_MR7G008064 [Morella rubra]|uniref:Uncharacterized protein n=1 Tax=Morella rubra TaxID=262757 RepID=A0A6A1V2T7_9ROSI|nr:hypothetical protein CJ030_MR7G008064 [Morella rubra]
MPKRRSPLSSVSDGRGATCGKTTWGSCGSHVASVYKRVPEGQRCNCRDWPGVKVGDDAAGESEPSPTCAIL